MQSHPPVRDREEHSEPEVAQLAERERSVDPLVEGDADEPATPAGAHRLADAVTSVARNLSDELGTGQHLRGDQTRAAAVAAVMADVLEDELGL